MDLEGGESDAGSGDDRDDDSNGAGQEGSFFVVAEILDYKGGAGPGKWEYLCLWEGYPDSEKTWEKEEALPEDLVREYREKVADEYQAGR